MTVIVVKNNFSICKLADFSQVTLACNFCFYAKTYDEYSLVCPSDAVPLNAVSIDTDWRMFRIAGSLDFSLVGILAQITSLLAAKKISVFAVSTFDTDYVLVKSDQLTTALKTLEADGYEVRYAK